MNDSLSILGWAVLAYSCGAIPLGYLVGKWHGVDLREHGSQNIGATNVTRVIGKPWGIIVFCGDFLKGYLPTLLGHAMLLQMHLPLSPLLVVLSFCCFLLPGIGHAFPFLLRFKGGKGVATFAGVLAASSPATFVAVLSCFGIVYYSTRIIAMASLLAAFMMPLTFGLSTLPSIQAALSNLKLANLSLFTQHAALWFGMLLGIAAFIFIRHRDNIKRILSGTEKHFKR